MNAGSRNWELTIRPLKVQSCVLDVSVYLIQKEMERLIYPVHRRDVWLLLAGNTTPYLR